MAGHVRPKRDAAPVRTTGAGARIWAVNPRAHYRRYARTAASDAMRTALRTSPGGEALETARARADALVVACSALAAGRFALTPTMLDRLTDLAAALAFDLKVVT